MNRAEIVHTNSGFIIYFNDIATLPEVNQTVLVMPKIAISEWMLNKASISSNNMQTCTYTLNTGVSYDTHAGVVSRGTDAGITVWFTDDDTATGTPDTQKMFDWIKDKLLQ